MPISLDKPATPARPNVNASDFPPAVASVNVTPCDPSPYRTIASALRAARDNRPAPTSDQRVRDRQRLARYLERNSPSTRATDARDARVADAVANRFHDTHDDYHAPRSAGPNTFSTRR